jgi:hypothetical protein
VSKGLSPPHWWPLIKGPQFRWVAWDEMRRRRQAQLRWASKIRRLFSVGPYVVYVMRYEPGQAPEETKERTP